MLNLILITFTYIYTWNEISAAWTLASQKVHAGTQQTQGIDLVLV